MSGFLYYVPGVPDTHLVCDGKLAYAFDSKPIGRRCYKGPDGAEGIVFGTEAVGFHDDKQTWQDVPFLDCWVGYYRDKTPNEADLRRNKMLFGKHIQLNAELWQIPVARSFSEIDGSVTAVCNLATHLSMDYATGQWSSGEIQEKYKPLWDAALRYWDIWWKANVGDSDEGELTEVKADTTVEIAQNELEDMTILALSTNYRISSVEVCLLKLISTEDCFGILSTICDLDSFNELVKKNLSQLENSGTDNGRQAKQEPTHQLSLTG